MKPGFNNGNTIASLTDHALCLLIVYDVSDPRIRKAPLSSVHT